uniref:Proheparin-binding EGF-like growth factor n=1 Tax=Castor canadensis TaxID=51338 RepID=A0A8C0WNI2_CASCN
LLPLCLPRVWDHEAAAVGGAEAFSGRSVLHAGDWREPGAASERTGGWNQQPGPSHWIYGPVATHGGWQSLGSPGPQRCRHGPFQSWFLLQATSSSHTRQRGDWEKKEERKGLGKKRDPCLRRYKDFCIHGECKYLKELRAPSCNCHPGYHGERCHGLSLPVENRLYTYDHTTILAVVAVVLSSVCLLVIVGLLMFRYHRRGGYDVENEEKMKLGMTNSH